MALKAKQKIEFSYTAAMKFAGEYVDRQFRVFICDEMVAEFNKTHEPPKDARIWGNIITALKAAGKIKSFGARLYKPNNGGKHRFATEWISKVYSEKQSAARRIDTGQINITFDSNGNQQ